MYVRYVCILGMAACMLDVHVCMYVRYLCVYTYMYVCMYRCACVRACVFPSFLAWFFANPSWTNHSIIGAYRTGTDHFGSLRTATHRNAPHRTNTALSRYCKLLTAPCYSAYCLLSATPSSATPAPRHSFPPPVAP